ncbi:MAG: GAF domain-containing protein, partial [Bdellovibrionota bacterium]
MALKRTFRTANSLQHDKPRLTVVEQSHNDCVTDSEKELFAYRKLNESSRLTTVPALSDLLRMTLGTAIDAAGADTGALWLYNNQKNLLTCHAAEGRKSEETLYTSIPSNDGPIGEAFQNNIAVFLDGFGITVPLSYGGETFGAINILTSNENNKNILLNIASAASVHVKVSLDAGIHKSLLNEVNIVRELHESFSSTIDLNSLLGVVLGKTIALLNAEAGSIWLIDKNTEKIECKFAEGPTKTRVIGVKLDRGVGIIGWVTENNKPSIVEDCSEDSRFSNLVDQKTSFITRSIISAPLTIKGECIGAIQILNKKGDNALFSKHDMDFLVLLASSAAMYIKNAQLFESERKAKELSALIEISKEITSTLDLDAVLMSIVNLSANIIDYKFAAISLVPIRGKDSYQVRAATGCESINHDDQRIKAISFIHNVLAKTKGELLINNGANEYAARKNAIPELVKYLEQYG